MITMALKSILISREVINMKNKCYYDENFSIKAKVKNLIYNVYQEFENELDFDYESNYKKEITEQDFMLILEALEKFTNKLELTINDEIKEVN